MDERAVAIELAWQAGNLLQQNWGERHLAIEKKGDIDLVTGIDRRSEELIRKGLSAAFPGYAILSEDNPVETAGEQGRWIVDPLDGTTNYVKGYPLVAISIGLEKQGELVLGVVYNPLADELFVAERGRGATLNDHPFKIPDTEDLSQALLASGFPYDAWTSSADNTAEWGKFVKRCLSVRCDGSAALDLCFVACGRLDGYWEAGLSPWDVAAGALIVAEAGGRVCDYTGGSDFIQRGQIIAANPVLAEQIRAVLSATAGP